MIHNYWYQLIKWSFVETFNCILIFYLYTEFPNLCQYCERMKTEFWPDWDKCITHGESGQTVK